MIHGLSLRQGVARSVGTLGVALALFGCYGVGIAQAAPGTASTASLHSHGPNAASYWTPERIRQAKPLPRPTLRDTDGPLVQAEPHGPPKYVTSSGVVRSGRVDSSASVSAQSHVGYDRYEVRRTRKYPARTNGNLLTHFRRLGDFRCSATVVFSKNKSLIFTAAHCLRFGGSTGGWAKKVTFIPGTRNGSRPFGKFGWRSMYVAPQWTQRRNNVGFDIGAVVLRPNRGGKKVQRVVGSRSIAWNHPRSQFYRAFGYPFGQSPFTGKRLFGCDSRYAGAEPVPTPGPQPMRIGCDFARFARGGDSGGGWIIRNEFLNSVISYSYADEPEHLYGPYFGRAAGKLWKRASRKGA